MLIIDGTAAADKIYGHDAVGDIISAGDGIDILEGGADNDIMDGGADSDFFIYTTPSFGQDTINNFQDGIDRFN